MQPHNGKPQRLLPPQTRPQTKPQSGAEQFDPTQDSSRCRKAAYFRAKHAFRKKFQGKKQQPHDRGSPRLEIEFHNLSLQQFGHLAGAPRAAADQQAPQQLPETSQALKMAALHEQQQDSIDAISDEIKSECRDGVLALFPEIEPDHLTLICEEGLWQLDGIIEKVLNEQEDGKHYPKAPKSTLKRKRSEDEDPTSPKYAAKKWDSIERRHERKDISYFKTRSASSKIPTFPKPIQPVPELRKCLDPSLYQCSCTFIW